MRWFLSHRPVSVDVGLLVVRAFIGFSMLVFHGWGKLVGGPETWTRIGASMEQLGIGFLPAMWGFFAAFAESVGSALLILGILTRPAAGLLAFTMFVAVLRHVGAPPDSPGAG